MSKCQVISILALRTLKDGRELMADYKKLLAKMPVTEREGQLVLWASEANKYPDHLLTIVKGEAILDSISETTMTSDMRWCFDNARLHVQAQIERRLEILPPGGSAPDTPEARGERAQAGDVLLAAQSAGDSKGHKTSRVPHLRLVQD